MSETPRALRIVLSALAATGITLAANGRDETRTRVTIRGTGNDITVERTETLAFPEKKPELSRGDSSSTVLSEAIRMKQSGGSDDSLLRYLRAHASQIPVVIDLESVNRLRRAGAGKPVLTYLASLSAIEIGDSGAVGGAATGPSPAYPASPETDDAGGYAAQYGFPVFGGYSAPSAPGRFGMRSFRTSGESRPPRFRAPALRSQVFSPRAQPMMPTRREFRSVVLGR